VQAPHKHHRQNQYEPSADQAPGKVHSENIGYLRRKLQLNLLQQRYRKIKILSNTTILPCSHQHHRTGTPISAPADDPMRGDHQDISIIFYEAFKGVAPRYLKGVTYGLSHSSRKVTAPGSACESLISRPRDIPYDFKF
jgi:hypothetical protein